VDVALVVGYDSLIEPETLVELVARRAASAAGLDTLAAPYESGAEGFVPGEAAAALVLRRCGDGESALAHVQAGEGADGGKGEPAAALPARLLRLLARPGDCVDGAGIARPAFDAAERATAADIVGRDAPLCCIMSAMGQIGAASSIVQTIALAELLRRQALPPIAGLRIAVPGPLRPLAASEATGRRAAVGLSVGAPGLGGIIRVELP
jgi:3-oxoacyl-(acyl-carrier-protein) synthase